jgi:hypothetical protein
MLSEARFHSGCICGAKHLPVKISFLAAPFMTTRPERRVTFLGYTTLDRGNVRTRPRAAPKCSSGNAPP